MFTDLDKTKQSIALTLSMEGIAIDKSLLTTDDIGVKNVLTDHLWGIL